MVRDFFMIVAHRLLANVGILTIIYLFQAGTIPVPLYKRFTGGLDTLDLRKAQELLNALG
jgi:hypothetical protein